MAALCPGGHPGHGSGRAP